MFDLLQTFTFLWNLQGIIDLHGNHGGKVYLTDSHIGQRIARWFHHNQFEIPHQRTYDHHLSSNIIQRHAKQGCVTFFQSQKVTSNAG